MPRVRRKWRPPLALVLFGALASMVGFSALSVFALLFVLRDWGWGMSLIVIGAALASVTLILAWLLARLILRPVTALAARARGDNAREPLPHYGTAELGAMGEAVQEMAARLHVRAEDLRAYADHVTHELKSPLTTIRASAELLGDDNSSPLPQRITEAAARMQALLDALQALARAGEGVEGQAKAAPIFLEAAQAAGLEAEAEDFDLPLAPEAARAIFDHLAGNAAAHGAIRITAQLDGTDVLIADNGQGISEGNQDRIFDPFFTTKRADGGTGMGLAITRRLLAARGITITLDSSDTGAAFRLSLED